MTTPDRLLAVAAAYVLGAVVLGRREGPVLCPYRRLTGHRCPACGLTRSIGRGSRLDLRGAVEAHPLGPAVAVAVTALAGARVVAAPRSRSPQPPGCRSTPRTA